MGTINAPVIVFSDHSTSLISYLIKLRTKGTYNHVMTLISDNLVASQDVVFAEKDVKRYMNRKTRLLFVEMLISDEQKREYMRSVEEKLALPWWKRRYDWYGILGQAVGITSFNSDKLNYCSEDIIRHLLETITDDKRYNEIIFSLDRQSHPDGLKNTLLSYPDYFRVCATWDHETGFRSTWTQMSINKSMPSMLNISL
jgi:hypothetical protein